MVHYLITLILLLTTTYAHAQECSEDKEVQQITSACHASYYKYAPSCKFGDSLCLSLVLQGLVSKNLFDYRPEIRHQYNTPLKRKVFSRTEEYKRLYAEMISDLHDASEAEFCAVMDTYWLYDVAHGGFTFLPHTLIPKGRLYRLTNTSKIANYDIIRVSERDALEIEAWETQASQKLAFFRLGKQTSGYVDVALTHFVWLIPIVSYDYEGEVQISYEEGCRTPSYYRYKVGQ